MNSSSLAALLVAALVTSSCRGTAPESHEDREGTPEPVLTEVSDPPQIETSPECLAFVEAAAVRAAQFEEVSAAWLVAASKRFDAEYPRCASDPRFVQEYLTYLEAAQRSDRYEVVRVAWNKRYGALSGITF